VARVRIALDRLVETGPDVGAAAAADLAHEERLEVGPPDIIRPSAGIDLDVVGAPVIRAVDQEAQKRRSIASRQG
jgi:hypothetical protein